MIKKLKQKPQFLHIRIDNKLMKFLNEDAGKLGLTISAYVRMIILKSREGK